MDNIKSAVTRVGACLEQASKHYKQQFWISEVLFDLTGTTAGMFCVKKPRQWIRINRILLDANPEEFFKQTIPHEVAHLVARQIYGRSMKHGPEWRAIMRDCFGLAPDRCHSMDTSISSKRPFVYQCSCMPVKTFSLSSRMHAQIQRRPGSRFCKLCKGALVLSHIEVVEQPKQKMESLFISAGTDGLVDSDLEKVRSIVGKHQIGRLILGPGCAVSKNAERLRKLLRVEEGSCRIHPSESTLPGALTHAVLIACNGNTRASRAAEVLREKGVIVRVLSRQGAPA